MRAARICITSTLEVSGRSATRALRALSLCVRARWLPRILQHINLRSCGTGQRQEPFEHWCASCSGFAAYRLVEPATCSCEPKHTKIATEPIDDNPSNNYGWTMGWSVGGFCRRVVPPWSLGLGFALPPMADFSFSDFCFLGFPPFKGFAP